MISRRKKDNSPPGQDSFLDVVANLVGILIILVVVVGAHAGSTWSSRQVDEQKAETLRQLESEAQVASREAASREKHNVELEQQIKEEEVNAKVRARERQLWQLQVRMAEQEIEKRMLDSDEQLKQSLTLTEELSQAQAAIETARRTIHQASVQTTRTEVIEHLPTPIAKTVFGQEVHYRLMGGRLARVPLEDLIGAMKSEWKAKAGSLENASHTVETVGPIDGFRLQYKLALVEKLIATPQGPIRREVPEFVGFVLLPTSDELGDNIDEALQDGSLYEQSLRMMDPRETTITVWVYPDSFDDYSRLKKWLYQRGFVSAGWPLPFGQPISGGPNGFRSTSQ